MEPKRNEFRKRMNQFKQAREANPQLSYWEWKMNLPDNLAYTPNWQYNNIGAWSGGLEPELYEDGYYHLGSRNPNTGEILKPKSHPTYNLAIEKDIKAGYFPYEKDGVTYTKTYAPTGDISGYADGTEGIEGDSILNDLKRNVRTELTPEQKLKLEQDIAKYSRMSGATRPVFDISDAVDMTPIGNAVMAKDMYDAVTGNDYITAGLIGASMVVPGVVGKQVKRYIPTVNRTVAEKINALRRNNNVVRETEWNNEINRSIERIYDIDVRDRAAQIKRDYGVDIQAQYDAIHDMYTNNYESIPKAKITSFADDSRAKMTTNKEATEAWNTQRRPAQASDFEMLVRSDVEPSREITDHEINHWWTYTMMQNPEWRKSQLQKITKDFEGTLNDVNPLDPNMSQYYRDWMEQNAYGINVINSMKALDIPITKDNVIKFINAKPDTSSQKRAAYQFKNMDLYYKWLQTMPLASLLGFGLIKQNEDNKYADGGTVKTNVIDGGQLPEINIIANKPKYSGLLYNIRKRAFDNISPYDTYSVKDAFINFKNNNRQDRFFKEEKGDPVEAVYAMYMGIPNKDLPFDKWDYIEDADYLPTKGTTYDKVVKLKDKNYFLNDETIINTLTKEKWVDKEDGSIDRYLIIDTTPKSTVEDLGPGWHDGTISVGKDDKGTYVSYYDEYNLNPIKGTQRDTELLKRLPNFIKNKYENTEDIFNIFGTTPVSVYDRRYVTKEELETLIKNRLKKYGIENDYIIQWEK